MGINRSGVSAGRPSPAQQALLDYLHALLPARPWWVLRAGQSCCSDFGDGLMLPHWHSSWRSNLPPRKDGCSCTVAALTNEEARLHYRRRPAFVESVFRRIQAMPVPPSLQLPKAGQLRARQIRTAGEIRAGLQRMIDMDMPVPLGAVRVPAVVRIERDAYGCNWTIRPLEVALDYRPHIENLLEFVKQRYNLPD
jgi:hypothetical protein